MRRIFVIGAGRSGTKFLMNTLNRSSSVHLAPEVHFFSALMHKGFRRNLRKNYGRKAIYDFRSVREVWASGENFGTYWRRDLPLDGYDLERDGQHGDMGEKEIYEFIMDYDCAQFSGKSGPFEYVGEKTPSNMFHIETLGRWFPDARFLYIYRDPIDVLQSEVNKDLKPDYPIARTNPLYPYGLTLYVWLVWVIGSLRVRRAIRKSKYNIDVVSYAGMVSNYQESARSIFGSLALDYSADAVHVERVDSSFKAEENQYWLAPAWVRGWYRFTLGRLWRWMDDRAINFPV